MQRIKSQEITFYDARGGLWSMFGNAPFALVVTRLLMLSSN